jgi:hypothetical protein
MSPITDLSALNSGWGICGFSSSLGALYVNDPAIKKTVDAAVKDGTLKYRMLAEIKTYLNLLRSKNRNDLLKEIENFTRTFPDFETFTINNYIATINEFAEKEPDVTNKKYSIAMPINGLVEYLKIVGNKTNAKATLTSTSTKDNVILGLYDEHKTLKHWVYKKSNVEVYNWGQVTNLETILAKYNRTILCEVSF